MTATSGTRDEARAHSPQSVPVVGFWYAGTMIPARSGCAGGGAMALSEPSASIDQPIARQDFGAPHIPNLA